MSKSILAFFTIVGTIVGAGVFALPYTFAQSGVITCLIYFLILTPVVVLLHLFFGEITLRTKEEQRLSGYTQKYLGKKAKHIVAASVIIGVLGSLVVYIILAGDFLSILLPQWLSPAQYSIIAWGFLAFLVFLGTRSVAWVEVLMTSALFLVVAIVLVACLPHFKTVNLSLFNPAKIILPFGIIMFSLVGWSAVSEAEDLLTDKKKLKKIIIIAVSLAAVFYCLFAIIISGVTGQQTSPEALKSLVSVLGYKMMIFGALFGLLAVATSFLTLANYLKNNFIFDYQQPRYRAFGLACVSPLLLFLLGLRNFIVVISFLGAIIGLIEGVALILIYLKARKHGDRTPEYALKIPKFVPYLMLFILFFGAIAQLFYQ
ncbi:MAG: aromatic amino acid transport family protein [Patescibacteria group bacterium]